MNISMLVESRRTFGLGHLYRSIGLANTLYKRGHNVRFYTTDVRRSQPITSKYLIPNTVTYDKIFADDDVTVFDSASSDMFYREMKTKCCHVGIVGDDSVDPNLDFIDLAICGGVPLHKDARIKWGFDYVLLWPGLHKISRNNFQARQKRRIFAYTQSYGILASLREALTNEFDVINVEEDVRSDDALAEAAVVVAPWGMTVCEAMFLGIPCVTFNMMPYAVESVEWAAENREVTLVDYKKPLFVSAVVEEVKRLLDTEYPKDHASLIDGLGCTRVADMIERM